MSGTVSKATHPSTPRAHGLVALIRAAAAAISAGMSAGDYRGKVAPSEISGVTAVCGGRAGVGHGRCR